MHVELGRDMTLKFKTHLAVATRFVVKHVEKEAQLARQTVVLNFRIGVCKMNIIRGTRARLTLQFTCSQ